MNYIARNVPTAPPLPGGRPPASVLLRGKRRASGRCARQARGRRDLGQPVGDVQVAGPGRACTRAARGTGRGGSAHRRSDAAGRRAARPRVGVPADGRARPRRRGPDRRGRNTGVPRHLQRPAQGLLRPAASGCAGREGGRADRDGARRGAFAGARSRAAPAVRERRRDGHRARRLCHERAVRRRDAGRRAARGRRPRGAGGGRAGERRQRLIIEEGDFAMSATTERPIAIYYEHPDWFRPLFQELDRRRVPYVRVDAADHRFDAADGRPPYALVFNRMSPSAYLRGHGNAIFYTLHYLAHLKSHGVRVINGYDAYVTETSKALQLSLLQQLGLPYPRARVINHASQAAKGARGLRFPVLVKPNIGGSGAGVRRFETPQGLEQAARTGTLDLGIDHTGLVQEHIPGDEQRIVRVEVLGGRYLYAIRIYTPGDSFNLCPADVCQTVEGAELVRAAWPVDAPQNNLRVEGDTPPPEIVDQVECIMRAGHIDVGSVEYLIDARDGQLYYYDINALSNFVADAPRVVGFDPFPRLVDYLEREAE